MSTAPQPAGAAEQATCNEVRLIGRVGDQPQLRELPSGDAVVTFRLVVPRGPRERRPPQVDTVDCAAWTAALRTRSLRLAADEVVEVVGRLRRRFWRGEGGPASRYEVEVLSIGRVPGSSRARRERSAR